MGQGVCGRTVAALGMVLVGLPPAIAMDRAGGSPGGPGEAFAAQPCPTRFDYLVLASFADAPSLLSLSTYQFRSEIGFSTIALTGLLRVDFRRDATAGIEPGAEGCRSRGGMRARLQTG